MSINITEKIQEYLNELIYDDLLFWKKIWKLTRETIDNLKKDTLKQWMYEKLWSENYVLNLEKILKYQLDTNCTYEIILKTLFHILSALAKDKDEKYWVNLCIISFLQFWMLFWYDVLDNDSDFFNPEKKENKVNKSFLSLWYNIDTYAPIDDNWEKNYIKFYSEMFWKIWYNELNNLYKIQNKRLKYSTFSICWLLWEHNFNLTSDQKKQLFSPWNLNYEYHPIIVSNLSINDSKKKLDFFHKEFMKVTEYSNFFCDFMFDCAWHKLLMGKSTSKKGVLHLLTQFHKKYKNISKVYKKEGATEAEFELMKNQFLFIDLLISRYNVEYILETSSIDDLRELFYYFYDKTPKTSWFNYAKDHKDDNIFYYWYVIFELSRIFLHRQIKKEQFDQLHALYEYTTKYPKVAFLYNLTLWKFSFSFVHIWTEYYLQWYNLLLKQMFKNFRLNNDWQWLEDFKNIWKEWSNAMWWYYEETDEDISKLIFADEWTWHEFKASLWMDRRKKLQTWKSEALPLLTIIKPIVAFLNWNVPGKIIVWIREGEKVKEEVEKEKYFEYKNLKEYWIWCDKKTNFHYITWIDLEIADLLWNKSDDNLKQRIDKEISKHIFPAPQIWWWTISIDVKKFLWKKILIIDIRPWNTVFCLKTETKKWKEKIEEQIIYVRKNWADEKVTKPMDIIKLTESKKWDIGHSDT